MSQVIEVTDATFESVVVKSPTPVLVDYWADWCAPCKQLSPVIDELAASYGDRVTFATVDTNVNQAIATDQQILSLPTIQVWRDGRVVKSLQGGRSRRALVRVLDECAG
ncbi:thioredoxin [Acidipropionibacterium acidipropionici]|jgi:thioredoxin 1|uniref:Thioredoxin n=2 Tax=Acidipropionibacterium acidipropionici TaxID=1748 RepID=A0AAC8YFR1_9ACTN|nr:thioredoxin domain-containing protein [Acidipropionibacterium acidipropionici]AMS05699.1 thioredoxin [Acidipropionibacterium acidipropionici]AOZ47165.1 thiol reductase thioredoxin [Acidipropionibacterium acidipropionici]AZP36731.1 thioredoxin [Acidipropionibacterium acidipropionici]QCV96546.1 thioredoxin [Acidipropionibacterium acidipropionici]